VIEVLLADNPQLQEFFGTAGGDLLVEGFLGTVLLLLSLLATGYAVTAALRLPGEEGAGRAEPLLATALKWRRARGSVGLTLGRFGGGLVEGAAGRRMGVGGSSSCGGVGLAGAVFRQ
jgi:ABC-2 type transport system permease protein